MVQNVQTKLNTYLITLILGKIRKNREINVFFSESEQFLYFFFFFDFSILSHFGITLNFSQFQFPDTISLFIPRTQRIKKLCTRMVCERRARECCGRKFKLVEFLSLKHGAKKRRRHTQFFHVIQAPFFSKLSRFPLLGIKLLASR